MKSELSAIAAALDLATPQELARALARKRSSIPNPNPPKLLPCPQCGREINARQRRKKCPH